jgi:epoxide hydrolase-like predicted phosphatase
VIEALLFDYGGVVSDGGKDFEPANRLANYLGIEKQDAYKTIDGPWDSLCKGLISIDGFWTTIENSLGRPIPDDSRAIWNTYEECMFPRPNIQKLLENLRASKYILGLLSDTVPPTARSIRESGGYDMFDFTILSCESGLRKPDQKIYELALSKLHDIAPQNVVFIDDNPKNLVPASMLGMETILATDSIRMVNDINSLLLT